jgi:hypothetical protein
MGILFSAKPAELAESFDDAQGILGTSLSGANQWTSRQYRNTGLVIPFLANADYFTQIVQMPHSKKLGSPVASFHLHWITTAAVTGTIIWDWAWGFYNENGTDPIPDTLPNTGQTTWNIAAADQYLPKVTGLINSIPAPTNETYSAILLVRCTRNGGTFGNNNEIGIRYADCHVLKDRVGSENEFYD